MPIQVAIYLYDDVEVLDFAGPFEVFNTAARVHARQYPDQPKLFEVFTLADRLRAVRARGGLEVHPAYSLAEHPAIDVLVVPGGIHSPEMERPEVIAWIQHTAARAQITASVCTGAFLLGKAGLLRGKRVTTHWEDFPDLQRMFPDATVEPDERWVDAGKVVTSAGISAGIDMSLYLVARLAGQTLAEKTARQMEYTWQQP